MKKAVVIGPESTGKSTLSKKLALHFNTVWIPEYARIYLDQLPRIYEKQDLLEIAEGQLAQERQQVLEAKDVLICDTDLYVIKVWSEHKYGDCDIRILQQIAAQHCDLYLLTYIDLPWEDDSQREHSSPEMRKYFYHVYRDIVMHTGVPWADIRGDYKTRENRAISVVRQLLYK